jgi:DNA-binding CsgD family transcriptional regulator
MTPSPLDHKHAEINPWGLTAYQCYVLRLYCEHGCTKRVAAVENISSRNVENHLLVARKRMRLFGNDIRLYLNWDRWVCSLTDGLDSKAESVQNPTLVTKKKPRVAKPGV